MKINLITGVDGSGKSTIFEKLQKLNFSNIAIVLVPQINEKSISDKNNHKIAVLINQIGIDATSHNNTHFKALNLFASMMLFSDLCTEFRSKKYTALYCERHPLIDAPIYAKFYAPLVNPDLIAQKDIDFLDLKYTKALDFILEKIPKEYRRNETHKSKEIFWFIYHYFGLKKETSNDFYKKIFRVDFPNKIYFLEGNATVFYDRILDRKEQEAHEKINVLKMLITSYEALISNLKDIEVERINANNFETLDTFFSKLVNEISCNLSSSLESFPNVSGRGLVTPQSTQMRQEFLKTINSPINKIKESSLTLSEVKNKIESFIGAIEIPLGLVGPLLYCENDDKEMVYTVGGTLEGALIASMNRGAKAISLSGGFRSHFVHQKMVRSPMFQFENLMETTHFKSWIKAHVSQIKKVCQNYSNHAKLIEITPLIISRSVHLNFVYETGDASGQNMTTTCTWHAMLWIVEKFENDVKIKIKNFVIEGNCSSDKKVSNYAIQNGRGVHVIAECHLSESIIQSVLRTTSDAIFNNYLPSISATRFYGMPTYNINVANAIAAIFVATGQDLACIHESSNAFLSLEKTDSGLYFSLTLPSLVIATIGGGTNLPKQQEVLSLMKCNGKNKIQRFAKLIAGFALGLEISTYSAIVSGAFAKSHEKLGRNKPINWMTRSEINLEFIKGILNNKINHKDIIDIVLDDKSIDNGIITTLSGTVNNKLIGFFTILLEYSDNKQNQKLILKSKAIDFDIIKGLHMMAAQINPELSDLISSHQNYLEYHLCHQKEIQIYKVLSSLDIQCIPTFYGSYENEQRETFFIFQEFIDENQMLIFDSENNPELWTQNLIQKTIIEISNCHTKIDVNHTDLSCVQTFNVNLSKNLYEKLLSIVYTENVDILSKEQFEYLLDFNHEIEKYEQISELPKVIIHNDFNPRNVAIRKDETICIYDWELVVINIPHRDIVEFLAFTLPDDFTQKTLEDYLHFHQKSFGNKLEWEVWKKGYVFALKEFIITRVTFYCAANIVLKLKFHKRILINSLKMLNYLEK